MTVEGAASVAPSAQVCVPWRPNGGWRIRNYRFVKDWWENHGFEVVEGDTPGSFNRAAARNAAASTSTADVLIFGDADTFGQAAKIRQAIRHAFDSGELTYPHTRTLKLDSDHTNRVIAGRKPVGSKVRRGSPAGILVVRRDVWEQYPWDEGFDGGWGYEDVAYMFALTTLVGQHRFSGMLYHLWHPVAKEKRAAIDKRTPNRKRKEKYGEAQGDREAMRKVVDGYRVSAGF